MKVHVNNKKLIVLLALMLFFVKSAKSQNNNQIDRKQDNNKEIQLSRFGDDVSRLVTIEYVNKLWGLLADCKDSNLTCNQQLAKLRHYKDVVYDSCLKESYKAMDSLRRVWHVPVSAVNVEYRNFCDDARGTVIEPYWYWDYYNVLQKLNKRQPIPVDEINGMLDGIRLKVFWLNWNGNEDLPRNVWLEIKNELLDCVKIKDKKQCCERLSGFPDFLDSKFNDLCEPEKRVHRGTVYGWARRWYGYYLNNLWQLCMFHYGFTDKIIQQQSSKGTQDLDNDVKDWVGIIDCSRQQHER